jgi:hypothetical protein
MYNGTNDYGIKKLIPAELIVSRTLQSRYRSFSNVIWRSGKPALDSEWNLINDMATELLTSLVQSKTSSGWLTLGKNKFQTNCGISNTVQFYAQQDQHPVVVPNAIVNGWPLVIAGAFHSDTDLNTIKLPPAGGTSRNDFVFLEVWRAQVRSRDTNNNPIAQNKPDLEHIFKFGNTQFGVDMLEPTSTPNVFKTNFAPLTTGTYKIHKNNTILVETTDYTINETTGLITFILTPVLTDKLFLSLFQLNLPDDIVDPAIKPSTSGIETSQRVQIQYRIRTVADVIFSNTESIGFDDVVHVQGQGANVNPQVAGYSYVNMYGELGDYGLWRAGNGDEASKVALGTVDGYTYGIPMFKIYRRSNIAYNDTGTSEGDAAAKQQGNLKVLADLISDRPDGKFNDGIDSSDILDLRNKVFTDGLNYQQILESNLDKLLKGELRSNKIQSLYYNSISKADINGYDDFLTNMGASGKRVYWSDASIQQSNIFGEVKISTTDNSLDVYRGVGTGSWNIGDTIVVKIQSALPIGTLVLATPRIYLEDITRTNLSSKGTWSGLNSTTATFTFSNVTGMSNYDIWVYYDILLPAGQGLTQVPDNVLQIIYDNYASFPSGVVVRGSRIDPNVTRFQDLFDHPLNNKDDNETYTESSVIKQRKQISISPLIQTTSTRNGTTRTLEVETLDKTAKTIYVPHGLQHLRGVYTAATGGTELAMQTRTLEPVDAVDVDNNQILITEDYLIGSLTSLKYDSTGQFVGQEVELLISAGGTYGPMFEHRVLSTDSLGTRVSLYDINGNAFDIPPASTTLNFRWAGKRIKVRLTTGYGYTVNGYIIDCRDSDNNSLIPAMPDRQQLWLDADYLGAPHSNANLKIIYSTTPYQGSDVGSQELSLVYKREKGMFFNNGTGGGTIDVEGLTGTSHASYTPVSPRLPGSFSDYLRNGATIEISSIGQKRFSSDFWSQAAYDVYGYHGGCAIWPVDYILPTNPETAQRGFSGNPLLEVVFELPVTDATYAEFFLPLLVRNKITGQLLLMIQIGNKGIHKEEEGPILIDVFHLDERILTK